MIAMMFSPDIYAVRYPTPLDVSSTDVEDVGLADRPEAQIKVALRYQHPTDIDEYGNPLVIESDPVYFDTNESNPNGAVPAGEWHTLEIPLLISLGLIRAMIVGVMMYTQSGRS